MTERTEKAILAGGCFWGMQDLIRKRPGVISTRVGYTGGDVANATYRNHGTHAEAIEIIFDPDRDLVSRPARVLLPDPRPHDAQPPGQRRGHELPLGDLLPRTTSSAGWPRTPSPTWRPQDSGPARSSPRSARRVPSGRPNPSTRTTSSTTRTATPAISPARAGCCRGEAKWPDGARQSWKEEQWKNDGPTGHGRLPMPAPQSCRNREPEYSDAEVRPHFRVSTQRRGTACRSTPPRRLCREPHDHSDRDGSIRVPGAVRGCRSSPSTRPGARTSESRGAVGRDG